MLSQIPQFTLFHHSFRVSLMSKQTTSVVICVHISGVMRSELSLLAQESTNMDSYGSDQYSPNVIRANWHCDL